MDRRFDYRSVRHQREARRSACNAPPLQNLSADARQKDLGSICRYLRHFAINEITRFSNRDVFMAH